MTDHTIDNDGLALAMSETGEGPDLLFVHGLGSAQVLWWPLIEVLANRYRCWNLDLRGHGASGRTPGRYNSSGYTSDVEAALDHIARPTIGIGHSLGGLALTWACAGGHPGLRALYVLDSPLFRPPGEQPAPIDVIARQLAMVQSFQAEGRPVEDYEAVLAQTANPVGGTNEETMVPAQLRGRAESLSQVDPECMAVMVDRGGPEATPTPTVAVSFRVLAADPAMGPAFRPEYGAMLAEVSPQAEVMTVDGVGHQLMMMQGFDDQIQADLEHWLDRAGS